LPFPQQWARCFPPLSPLTKPSKRLSCVLASPLSAGASFTEPGLHFKLPFIENVVILDNRILDVESPNLEVLASDNQRL